MFFDELADKVFDNIDLMFSDQVIMCGSFLAAAVHFECFGLQHARIPKRHPLEAFCTMSTARFSDINGLDKVKS